MAFRFAGRLVQDGVAKIFVSKGDTPLAVKVGDTLDGYLVESIGSNAIALVYPPLGTKASISISSAGDGLGQGIASSATTSPLQAVPIAGAAAAPAAALSTQAIAAAGAAAPASARGARVQWDGPAQLKTGANFSLTLRVDGDQPISASPMQLRFDPAVLESVSVRPGKLYAADAGREFNYRVNPDGSIFVGASSRSASGAGGAELLVLTFRPLKSGAFAEVSLTALHLQGLAGRAVAHDALTAFRAPVTP